MAQTLTLRGHNIGMDKPMRVQALDNLGNPMELSLQTLLDRLNDFEGQVGKLGTKDYLIYCLFRTHQDNKFTEHELSLFETYIHSNGETSPIKH